MSEKQEEKGKKGGTRRGGKATDGVRKMRMTNAVSRGNTETLEATSDPTEAPERAATASSAAATREKRVRITVDATRDQHRRLKMFAMDAGTDGMSVMRALLEELNDDPELAERVRERLSENQ